MNRRQLYKLTSLIPNKIYRKNLIDKYQSRYLNERFSYHIHYLNIMTERLDFRNKVVLDAGGSNIPRDYMINYLGVKKFISIDYISEYWKNSKTYHNFINKNIYNAKEAIEAFEKEDCFVIDDMLSNIPEYFYGKFDIIISIDAFEHIFNLRECIDIIYKLLKEPAGGGGGIYLLPSNQYIHVCMDIIFGMIIILIFLVI